ncbi:MAG TPA: protein translocase subunit SecD [Patescibacteria group bacterium]|nr:protein translocase subunit SecD [Patescibacteria group bacterium]
MKNQTKVNLRAKVRWGIVGILVLLAAAVIFDVPVYFNRGVDKVNAVAHLGLPKMPEKGFNLGLDLRGGAHLVYRAQVGEGDEKTQAAAVEGVRDVIERRVNAFGVGESVVQTTKVGEEYRLIVELPGVTDVKEAIKMIGETPTLEFKEENTEPPRELTKEEVKQLSDYNKKAEKTAKEVLQKSLAGNDFGQLVADYSEDQLSKNNGGYLGYVSRFSPYKELYDWAENAAVGLAKNYVQTKEGYNIVKKGQEKTGETEVRASHILLCYLGAIGCDQPEYTAEEALAKAQEIYSQANAENFAALAKEYSVDPGSEDKGGDLGYFTRGMMDIQEFGDAVFQAQVGEIVGPIKTDFGYHVIYKQDERQTKEYEIWRVLVSTKDETDILPPTDPWKSTGLSGKQLGRSEVVTDQQTGAVQVSLQFNEEGTRLFKEITARNVGKVVGIFLDGQPISTPVVNEPIPDGRAVISGSFGLSEAKLLVQRLNSGALPVPVELIGQETVGASLGMKSLSLSLRAGLIGVALVMLYMLFYYRLPGFLSIISLCLYIAVTLALFKLIGVTLTLAGIAGFILSVGMAVDANVLIFERSKEELASGKSLKAAVEEGFNRAWTSIRDSNISTLISCVLLMWFGTSFVKGFAVTLTIGILVSMFTAITVTRVMLRFICPWFKAEANWLFLGAKKK